MNRFGSLVLVQILLIGALLFIFLRKRREPVAIPSSGKENYMIRKHPFAVGAQNYTIYTLEHLLTPQECELLRVAATSTLRRSGTISKNPISEVRTSHNTFLNTNSFRGTSVHDVLQRIDHVASTISGKPLENQEPLQVARYLPGQYYNEHFDACVPENTEMCKRDSEGHGMRYATLIVYMNDVEEGHGGETAFPLVNAQFKPKVGTGIFFFNLLPSDESKHHPLSKHAALPLKEGVKWICNKWIRCAPYRMHQ